MTAQTKKGLYVVGGVLALAGAYYFLVYRKKQKAEKAKDAAALGKSAIMLVDGWVYNMDKTQAYQKKKNEWAGADIKPFDNKFWQLKNTTNKDILAKKSELKTI